MQEMAKKVGIKSAPHTPQHPPLRRRWLGLAGGGYPLYASAILVVFKCIRARRGALWVVVGHMQCAAKGRGGIGHLSNPNRALECMLLASADVPKRDPRKPCIYDKMGGWQ
jgi:hypothetical protein